MDLLLVGDSLAMVIYGMETTRGVTLDAMINHGAAVMRGSERACVVVDLPHGTYEDSPEQAYTSAHKLAVPAINPTTRIIWLPVTIKMPSVPATAWRPTMRGKSSFRILSRHPRTA